MILLNTGMGLKFFRPCFQTEVEGTTGSGVLCHCRFSISFFHKGKPEDKIINAAAFGALSVEQTASISVIPVWEKVTQSIERDWLQHKTNIQLSGWK